VYSLMAGCCCFESSKKGSKGAKGDLGVCYDLGVRGERARAREPRFLQATGGLQGGGRARQSMPEALRNAYYSWSLRGMTEAMCRPQYAQWLQRQRSAWSPVCLWAGFRALGRSAGVAAFLLNMNPWSLLSQATQLIRFSLGRPMNLRFY
jgi:hypothetical protein